MPACSSSSTCSSAGSAPSSGFPARSTSAARAPAGRAGDSPAGALGIVVAVLVFAHLRGHAQHALAALLAAAGMLAATALAVFTGSADVTVPGQALSIEVGSTRWPGWVGLALAAIAGGACLAAFLTAPRKIRIPPQRTAV